MSVQPAYQFPAEKAASNGKLNHRSSSSIQKMAVLFTDIVGSSGYFKRYGDMAGREMLRRHQSLASSPVNHYGGVVVKVLGDSVMAYFTDPKEALKAAVTIQKSFIRNNQTNDPKKRINIRIGLHYGDGIVDKGDIYGDVVNIAAKFLPLVKGGEICISEQLHSQVKDIPWARFERLNLNTRKEILKTLVVFKVTWDNKADLTPSVMTVVVLRPIWNLADDGFKRAWSSLMDQRAGLWPASPGKSADLPDGSLVLYTKDPSTAVDIARTALNYLRQDSGNCGLPFLPLQTLIDTGRFSRAGEPALEGLAESWSHARPGEIAVAGETFRAMNVPGDLRVIPTDLNEKPPFFRLVPKDTTPQEEGRLFLYQHSIGGGKHDPCFYCGARRHLPAECPSKQLPDVTHGLDRLGYYSLDQINEAYLEYLSNGWSSASKSPYEDLAAQAFFEIKKVFQLRSLRNLWASKAQTWSGLEARNEEGEKGGLTWIGQDCIRVSNLEQAESVLVAALAESPNDYLALCTMGFLQIEKGNPSQAKKFFKHALDKTHALPRELLTRFLLARVYELSGQQRYAEDQVRRILLADSLCQEALYLDVHFKFREGNHNQAMRRLRRLIEINRNYFVAALIDPELAKYSNRIHPAIKKILKNTAEQAELLSSQAADAIEKAHRLPKFQETELQKALSYNEKILELSGTESYYGLLDAIYYAEAIVRTVRKSGEHARRKLLRAHGAVKERHLKCARFVEDYPHESFLGSLPQDLASVGKQVHSINEVIQKRKSEWYGESLTLARDLAGILERIETKIDRLENLRLWIRIGLEFGKKAFLMEGTVVLIALLLFPAMGHYLNVLIPDLMFSPENIWGYQKGILIVGGILGLFLAFLMSARNVDEK